MIGINIISPAIMDEKDDRNDRNCLPLKAKPLNLTPQIIQEAPKYKAILVIIIQSYLCRQTSVSSSPSSQTSKKKKKVIGLFHSLSLLVYEVCPTQRSKWKWTT